MYYPASKKLNTYDNHHKPIRLAILLLQANQKLYPLHYKNNFLSLEEILKLVNTH